MAFYTPIDMTSEPDEKRFKPYHHIVGEGPKELVLLLVDRLTGVSQLFL